MNREPQCNVTILASHVLKEMISTLALGPEVVKPSRYWQFLNRKNLEQLAEHGYANFKRTVALNYFTWIVNPFDRQIRALTALLPILTTFKAVWRTLLTRRFESFSWRHTWAYSFLTQLVWAAMERQNEQNPLPQLAEPEEGNAPRVLDEAGQRISQDLANSIMEYRSIMLPHGKSAEIKTVFELGAGYGRDAFVFLKLNPSIRYVIIDIAPALFVAQNYLTSQFRDRKVFPFRPFEDYEEIREEFESANIAFLLPSQLHLLPDQSTDLFINISSLHEMRLDQITHYFGEISRLTRKLFYTKQWQVSTIPEDNVVITAEDYPVSLEWRCLFHRACTVQTNFFEALYFMDQKSEDKGNAVFEDTGVLAARSTESTSDPKSILTLTSGGAQ